jgi:hypothetical protein
MPDDDDKARSWTVKGVTTEARTKAKIAAERVDQTQGEWLSEAVTRAADQQAGMVIPPGRPEVRPDAPEAPAHPAIAPGFDPAGYAQALQATKALYEATGTTIPKAVAREAWATMQAYGRAARGHTPRQTGGKTGQTKAIAHDPFHKHGDIEGPRPTPAIDGKTG